jgi:hypothetical protein
MKRLAKILRTNWIHLLGFYVTTYFSIVLFHYLGSGRFRSDLPNSIYLLTFSIPMLFFTYGLVFLASFYTLIIFLDLIAFHFTKLSTKSIMLLEWGLIIPPFIYWAFTEEYWLWLVLVTSLLVTQLIRIRMINR